MDMDAKFLLTMEANNKAMREALDKIARCMDAILARTELDDPIHRKALEAQNIADGYLLLPPRNMEANNMKAMREALEEIVANIEMRASVIGLNAMVDTKTFLDAKAALAAPPRNCDVGTAEEQAERMVAFCSRCGKDADGAYRCENCILLRVDRCELAWAQMPYEKGGEK